MSERRIKTLNLTFSLVLLFSFLACVAGPLAVALGISSTWLFAWPPTFWIVRFLGFFVFPLVALLFIFLARPTVQPSRKLLRIACLNLVLALSLVLTIWGIESGSMEKARFLYAEQAGNSSPSVSEQRIVGREIPNVPLLGLDGKQVDLKERIQGAKVTLIVFWASYDTPWSQNVRLATAIHRAMPQQGVSVIGINEQESLAEVKSFLSAQGLSFPVFSDPDGKFFREMGLWFSGSVEQMVVVDKTGRVAVHLNAPESEEAIKRLLEATSEVAPATEPTQTDLVPQHD